MEYDSPCTGKKYYKEKDRKSDIKHHTFCVSGYIKYAGHVNP